MKLCTLLRLNYVPEPGEAIGDFEVVDVSLVDEAHLAGPDPADPRLFHVQGGSALAPGDTLRLVRPDGPWPAARVRCRACGAQWDESAGIQAVACTCPAEDEDWVVVHGG